MCSQIVTDNVQAGTVGTGYSIYLFIRAISFLGTFGPTYTLALNKIKENIEPCLQMYASEGRDASLMSEANRCGSHLLSLLSARAVRT